ncbi:MAG: sulfur carrier protein ThiS [Candidatus Omnitrophota bacterium]
MIVRINGKEESMIGVKDLLGLLRHKGLEKGKIVVEYNSEIIPERGWGGIALKEDDSVEIVSFVGGG